MKFDYEKIVADYKAEYKRTSGRDINARAEKGWVVLSHPDLPNKKYRPSEIIQCTERLKLRETYKEMNIMGDMVAPKGLTFKFEKPHLTIFRGTKFAGMVVPNGWTGKSKSINYQLSEPILTNYDGEISLSEMKEIIQEWQNNI